MKSIVHLAIRSFRAVRRRYPPITTKRKEKLSPGGIRKGRRLPPTRGGRDRAGISFFASYGAAIRRASLTVETAVALPVLIFCVCAMLQFITVMGSASRMGAALAQTAEEMAAGAYFTDRGEADTFFGTVLSSAFAQVRFLSLAGDVPGVRDRNLLLSSVPDGEGAVDLVLTYRASPVTGGVQIPFIVFVQRGRVRAWTGREGSGTESADGGDPADTRTVYVTQYGQVYHTDPECSHIRLHIMTTDTGQVGSLRNEYGEKYRPCSCCRGGSGTVYITTDGNRYHSSLTCSGLKRTVREMSLEEASALRPCSRCGRAHTGGHGD